VIQPRWGVYLLKRKGERMPFTVTARNSEEAIERVQVYGLDGHSDPSGR
jgi:hypothetical protein